MEEEVCAHLCAWVFWGGLRCYPRFLLITTCSSCYVLSSGNRLIATLTGLSSVVRNLRGSFTSSAPPVNLHDYVGIWTQASWVLVHYSIHYTTLGIHNNYLTWNPYSVIWGCHVWEGKCAILIPLLTLIPSPPPRWKRMSQNRDNHLLYESVFLGSTSYRKPPKLIIVCEVAILVRVKNKTKSSHLVF